MTASVFLAVNVMVWVGLVALGALVLGVIGKGRGRLANVVVVDRWEFPESASLSLQPMPTRSQWNLVDAGP